MSEAEDPRRVQRKQSSGEVTVEDVRQLMGASTPHFALQLRNRIAALIGISRRGTPPASKASARSRGSSACPSAARTAARASSRASGRCPRSSCPETARRR